MIISVVNRQDKKPKNSSSEASDGGDYLEPERDFVVDFVQAFAGTSVAGVRDHGVRLSLFHCEIFVTRFELFETPDSAHELILEEYSRRPQSPPIFYE